LDVHDMTHHSVNRRKHGGDGPVLIVLNETRAAPGAYQTDGIHAQIGRMQGVADTRDAAEFDACSNHRILMPQTAAAGKWRLFTCTSRRATRTRADSAVR